MQRIKGLFYMFFAMFKIGLFTFGGGYAMISLLQAEFVSKRGWIGEDEFLDLVAIAESTPGPIAINCSTYIGYIRGGFFGSLFATVGMCLPSFIIIYIISLFFDSFMSVGWIASAFKGIKICVVFLILSAGIKMLKKIKKNFVSLIVLVSVVALMIVFEIFAVEMSSIVYIIASGAIGFAVFCIKDLNKNLHKKGDEK